MIIPVEIAEFPKCFDGSPNVSAKVYSIEIFGVEFGGDE
jgi:hypothetical protein